jgi:hypothetical protein
MKSRNKALVHMHNEVKKNKIWQAAVLVLLMGVIYEVHR